MTDKIKSTREAFLKLIKGGGNIGKDGRDDGGHRYLNGELLYDDYMTILEALSAYEKLRGVDFEELRDAIQILETWDTSRDGYIKPKYFPMRDVVNAARIVADIGKDT